MAEQTGHLLQFFMAYKDQYLPRTWNQRLNHQCLRHNIDATFSRNTTTNFDDIENK